MPERQRMKEIAAREITAQEAEVLELALQRGRLVALPDSVFANLRELRVVGVCECGCRSIYLSPESQTDRRVADTFGRTADGRHVDVMVWGVDGRITALELVDCQSAGQLPMPDSIGRPAD